MPAAKELSERIEANSDLAEGARQVAAHSGAYRQAVADAAQTMRSAGARVTSDELSRWEEFAAKHWSAQLEVVRRHGLPTGRHGSPHVIRRQMRRCWLGNLVGFLVPLWIFGLSSFSHGLSLPLFWALAVAADVCGKATCLRVAPVARAALTDRRVTPPDRLAGRVRAALTKARNGGTQDWASALKAAARLQAAGEALDIGRHRLELCHRNGARLVAAAAIAAAAVTLSFVSMDATSGVIKDVLVVTAMGLVLIGVFGAGMWMTAAAHREVIARSPYPRPVAHQRVAKCVRYEHALSPVADSAFTSSDSLRDHSTEAMRRVRSLAQALRVVDQREKALRRSRAELGTLLGIDIDIDITDNPSEDVRSVLDTIELVATHASDELTARAQVEPASDAPGRVSGSAA